MTNGVRRPIPRDGALDQEGLRERIDAIDEQAEAVLEQAESSAKSAEDAPEDVVPDHPAPEPPD